MPESTNLNIFAGAPARFPDALPLFSGLSRLVLPVRAETSGEASFFTLADYDERGQRALAAFTGEALVSPPFILQGLPEAAALFFHAPSHEIFAFNPAHPQRLGEAAPLPASRHDISLLAGFAKSGSFSGDPSREADNRMSMGDLHGAHYLYSLAHSRNPASRARFSMCAAMIELGLLQEAYDLIKDDPDMEARLWLAVIHRKTGNSAQARILLAEPGFGSHFDERRALETAWLDLEDDRDGDAEKTFQKLSAAAFDKSEALAGYGSVLAKTAFRTKDRGRLSTAISTLRAALVTPSPAHARIFFQLGNLYFRSGDMGQAEACYRRTAAISPAVQTLANLALTLIKTGKHEEAAAVTAQIALTDLPSASRLAAEFPRERTAALFNARMKEAEPPPPAPPPKLEIIQTGPPSVPKPRPAPPVPEPVPPPVPGPGKEQPSALDNAAGGFQFVKPSAPKGPEPPQEKTPPPAPDMEVISLAPAQPKDSSISGRTGRPPQAAPAPSQEVKIESFREVMSGNMVPSEEESRKDAFISRAFKLASDLEDELGRKIYFNLDGLSEAEKKLRLQFLKAQSNPQANIEMVKDTAAFLCYFLQERYKARLLKLDDFDPWGWPMLFERPGLKFTSYPVQRTWRLLWDSTVPEPGWLSRYASWIGDRLKQQAPPTQGAEAVLKKVSSHAERIVDAQTEHRRMLVLITSLNETSHIEFSLAGVHKLESTIKNNFRPNVPPTTDGWKLLRCFGHLLAAILIKEYKAAWYNVDGEDGGWSLRLPWSTFVFPLGKVYKTASARDDLSLYFEALESEKARMQGPPAS